MRNQRKDQHLHGDHPHVDDVEVVRDVRDICRLEEEKRDSEDWDELHRAELTVLPASPLDDYAVVAEALEGGLKRTGGHMARLQENTCDAHRQHLHQHGL